MRDRVAMGAAISRARRAAGLTQAQVADRAQGMSRPRLAMIENGKVGMLVETLCAIADAVGVPVARLLGELPPPQGMGRIQIHCPGDMVMVIAHSGQARAYRVQRDGTLAELDYDAMHAAVTAGARFAAATPDQPVT